MGRNGRHLLSIVAIYLSIHIGDGAVRTKERELLENILKGYDTNIRPVLKYTDPVRSTVDFSLTQIVDFNFRQQQLTTNVWMRMTWNDEHFPWNETEYNGISRIYVDPKLVWRPDITLYNDVSEKKANAMMDFYIRATSDGTLRWAAPITVTTSCNLDVTYFPWDLQTCFLMYASWMFDSCGLEIKNVTAEMDLGYYVPHGEWELTRGVVRYEEIDYGSCCPCPYPSVYFDLHLRRRPMYYLNNLIYPCIFITMTALAAFCLPPDSGEKISLSVTVLLATTVFLLVINESMPVQSLVVPYIAQYFMGVMSMLAISVAMTVLVLSVHHKGSQGRPLSPWVRKVFLVYLARWLGMSGVVRRTLPPADPDKVNQGHGKGGQTWANKVGEINKPGLTVTDLDINTEYGKDKVKSNIAITPDTNTWLKQIAGSLEYFREHLTSQQVDEDLKSEWICLALVLDRVFFILFVVIIVIVCTVFLLHRPE